jgi:hypothetical protein
MERRRADNKRTADWAARSVAFIMHPGGLRYTVLREPLRHYRIEAVSDMSCTVGRANNAFPGEVFAQQNTARQASLTYQILLFESVDSSFITC